MKRLIPVCLLAVALSGWSMPAVGHVQNHPDPNDTKGKLDIEQLQIDHTGKRLILSQKMHQDWTLADLDEGASLGFRLDTTGDERFDYTVILFAQQVAAESVPAGGTERELECRMLNRDGELVEEADGKASKRGKRCKCRVRKSAMERRKSKKLNAKADSRAYTGPQGPCPYESGGCQDKVPNHGTVEHDLGG